MDITLKDLAEISGKKVTFNTSETEEQKGYSTVTRVVMSSEKIRKIGWKPIYSIQGGNWQDIINLERWKELKAEI